MLLKCQYNKYLIQITKRNFNQKFRTWDGKSLLEYILKFDGKNLKRRNDFLEVTQSKFHKNGENFIIYNKKSKLPVMYILSFVILGLNLFLFYYITKNMTNRPKTQILLLLINTFLLYKFIRSDIWRLGRYIKTLEMNPDLSKLIIKTFNNKTYNLKPEDVNKGVEIERKHIDFKKGVNLDQTKPVEPKKEEFTRGAKLETKTEEFSRGAKVETDGFKKGAKTDEIKKDLGFSRAQPTTEIKEEVKKDVFVKGSRTTDEVKKDTAFTRAQPTQEIKEEVKKEFTRAQPTTTTTQSDNTFKRGQQQPEIKEEVKKAEIKKEEPKKTETRGGWRK